MLINDHQQKFNLLPGESSLLLTARGGGAYFAGVCFARELDVNFSFQTFALSLDTCLEKACCTDFYQRE